MKNGYVHFFGQVSQTLNSDWVTKRGDRILIENIPVTAVNKTIEKTDSPYYKQLLSIDDDISFAVNYFEELIDDEVLADRLDFWVKLKMETAVSIYRFADFDITELKKLPQILQTYKLEHKS